MTGNDELKGERACPRCGTRVKPERFQSGSGRTWLWRCQCGWSRALAERGVTDRADLLARFQRGAASEGD